MIEMSIKFSGHFLSFVYVIMSAYNHEQFQEADRTASLLVKWENYLARNDGKLQKNQELKTLIRQGIPHKYRAEVWKG